MTSTPASEYQKNLKAKKRTTMARRNAKRDASESEIVKTLEAFGMSVFLLNEPTDAIVGFRGITYIVEFKSGRKGYGKALNDNQQAFADQWRGSAVVTLHSRDEAIAWAQDLAGKAARGER